MKMALLAAVALVAAPAIAQTTPQSTPTPSQDQSTMQPPPTDAPPPSAAPTTTPPATPADPGTTPPAAPPIRPWHRRRRRHPMPLLRRRPASCRSVARANIPAAARVGPLTARHTTRNTAKSRDERTPPGRRRPSTSIRTRDLPTRPLAMRTMCFAVLHRQYSSVSLPRQEDRVCTAKAIWIVR